MIDQFRPGKSGGFPTLPSKTSLILVNLTVPFKNPKGGELTAEQKAFNRVLGALRVRVEHCIGWAKNWAILATRFRCAHTVYTAIMCTICGLVNVQTQRWQTAKANCASTLLYPRVAARQGSPPFMGAQICRVM